MSGRKVLCGAALALASVVGVPTVAQAATTSLTTTATSTTVSIPAVPLCKVNPTDLANVSAEINSVMSAQTVCNSSAAIPLTQPIAQPDATLVDDDCGTLTYSMRANDPSDTWFHEEVDWEDMDPIMGSGFITAYWENITTGGHNNYSWSIVFLSDASYERDVHSGAGLVAGYEAGAGTLVDGTICSGATSDAEVYVS